MVDGWGRDEANIEVAGGEMYGRKKNQWEMGKECVGVEWRMKSIQVQCNTVHCSARHSTDGKGSGQ